MKPQLLHRGSVSYTHLDVYKRQFIDYIVSVINGEKTNNEKNRFQEIAIFKSGVTL